MDASRFDRLARLLAARLSRRRTLRAAAGAGLGAVAPSGTPPATPLAAGIDQLVSSAMADAHVAGLGLAVVAGGRPILTRGYGLADVAARTPVTAETAFEVGSVTKAFTAMGVLLLLDRPALITKPGVHALDLDAPLGGLLANSDGFTMPPAWSAITPRQLLSMTGGVPDGASQTEPWQRIVARVGRQPLVFAPGTGWCYSNPGFMVLGELLQQFTGQLYDQFMARELFAPLGLAHTVVHTPTNAPTGLAQGYAWNGAWSTPQPRNPLSSFSAGAIITAPSDLGTWLAALVTGRLLAPGTYDLMWSDVPLPKGPSGWGLGWAVGGTAGDRAVGKDGAVPGYSAQVLVYPDRRLAVGILTNADAIDAALLRLAKQVAATTANGSLPTLSVPVSACPS